MLCAAMCLTSNSLMVFADTNANINTGEIINMVSDGKNESVVLPLIYRQVHK